MFADGKFPPTLHGISTSTPPAVDSKSGVVEGFVLFHPQAKDT